jgi:hypothetical protein
MNQIDQQIHSLETIKEYKQENYENVKKIANNYNKQDEEFKTNHRKTKTKISESKKRSKSLAEDYFKMRDVSGGYASTIELDLEEGNTLYLEKYLNDIDDDIVLLKKKRIETNDTLTRIKKEIEQIDLKIDQLKKRKKNKKYKKNKVAGTTTEDCPKICTISDIKIKCSHSRNFSLSVPPYHDGNDIPYLHVISGSEKSAYDVIDVDFNGNCDHGKVSSRGDKENTKHELFVRNSDHEKYCPKVEIINGDTNTSIHQPSMTKFAAALPESSLFSSGELKVVKDLIFNKEDATQDYDLQFNSCSSSHPYKARIIAHPKWSWNFDMEFGYNKSTKIQGSAYTQDESLYSKLKYLFTDKPETYDDLESNGGWEAAIKAGYKYDIHKLVDYNRTLSLKGLAKELQSDWKLLNMLETFYAPINGFFELAKYKNKNTGDGKVSDEDAIATIKVDWTKLKISGSAESAEVPSTAEVGVKGTFSIGFEPLIGLTGSVNIMHLMLTTLGGGFGKYLNKVANMSLGSKDKSGKVDTDKMHIKTNLKLIMEANASIKGNLAFESTDETLWQAAKSDAKISSGKDGASNVSGFIGLSVTGDASISGLIWDVRFASGGMFKTASEDGTKPSGIEASLKPIVMNNKYSAAGYIEFTGLSVIYAVYSKIEAAGLENRTKEKITDNLYDDDDETEIKDAFEQKNETRHILFKKRILGSLGDDTISLSA